MDCEWRSKLDPFVDAELSEQEAAQMEAHVLACASCAAEALSRTRLKSAVRSAAVAAFSPRSDFVLQVQSLIQVSRGELEKGAEKRSGGWFRWPRQLAFAGAAAAVVILAVALWFNRGQRPQAIGEVADLHVATLASSNPVDVVSTDRHTVKPWFAGKLPFTFNLPDLDNTPYRLLGGRVAYLDQTPGAQLLFAVGKHQISVFIFPDRGGLQRLGSGFSEKRSLQFVIDSWSAGGLRYFVIGDASADDLHSLATLIRNAA
jgi:anti-sigma factor RsiW